MNKKESDVIKEYILTFNIPSGVLMVYGDSEKAVKGYIGNAVDCVEDVCVYCKNHDLKVYHKTKFGIVGLLGFLRTYRLCKKHSVYSSFDDLYDFIKLKAKE